MGRTTEGYTRRGRIKAKIEINEAFMDLYREKCRKARSRQALGHVNDLRYYLNKITEKSLRLVALRRALKDENKDYSI